MPQDWRDRQWSWWPYLTEPQRKFLCTRSSSLKPHRNWCFWHYCHWKRGILITLLSQQKMETPHSFHLFLTLLASEFNYYTGASDGWSLGCVLAARESVDLSSGLYINKAELKPIYSLSQFFPNIENLPRRGYTVTLRTDICYELHHNFQTWRFTPAAWEELSPPWNTQTTHIWLIQGSVGKKEKSRCREGNAGNGFWEDNPLCVPHMLMLQSNTYESDPIWKSDLVVVV